MMSNTLYTEDNLWGEKTSTTFDNDPKENEVQAEDDDRLIQNTETQAKQIIHNQKQQQENEEQEHEESSDEPNQFDHLVPPNWEQIADMRLRMLEKEYMQCSAKNMGDEANYEYKGLKNILGIEERLKLIADKDLQQAIIRSQQQAELEAKIEEANQAHQAAYISLNEDENDGFDEFQDVEQETDLKY